MRRVALVVGCIVAGLVAGGIWTVLQSNPAPGRNLLIGGLAGLIVGLAVAAVLPRRPSTAPAADPAPERRQSADQLAARETDLRRREAALEEAAAAPEPEPEPEPEPAPEPEPEPEPEQRAPAPSAGGWTLTALEALTDERTEAGASASQQEEWSTYLFLLRDHAAADGTLPASFDGLVNDIFGPLPQRSE